jgi:hypothetical protein
MLLSLEAINHSVLHFRASPLFSQIQIPLSQSHIVPEAFFAACGNEENGRSAGIGDEKSAIRICESRGDRISSSVKGIRVKVAVKGASKCRDCAKHTPRSKSGAQALRRTLRCALNRPPYSDTLKRPIYRFFTEVCLFRQQ